MMAEAIECPQCGHEVVQESSYEKAIVRLPNGDILLRGGVKWTQLDRIEAMLVAVIHALPELESWRSPVKQMYPEFDPLK